MTDNLKQILIDQNNERDSFIAHVKQLTEGQFTDEQCYLVYEFACIIQMAVSNHNTNEITPLIDFVRYAIGIYQISMLNRGLLTTC